MNYRSFSYQLKNRSYHACIMRVAVVSETYMVLWVFFISIEIEPWVKNRYLSARLHAFIYHLNSALFRGLRIPTNDAWRWYLSVQAKINIMYRSIWIYPCTNYYSYIQWILFNLLGRINFSRLYKCYSEQNSFVSCLL